MTDAVVLSGYRYSSYTRTVRLALLTKEVDHSYSEADPFSEVADSLSNMHPFGRVPVLQHGSLEVFETGAITRYIDRAFQGQALQPDGPFNLARMDQVIGVIDAYAYRPMVRQVASHGFSRPHFGEDYRSEEVDAGMQASRPVLRFLNRVAEEGAVLTGQTLTLADFHLAPVIDYFTRPEEGRRALSEYLALSKWWRTLATNKHIRATDPFSPGS
ncbi:MAG: glutathione S-transferase family protein [Brevundimonas sp.]|uniref:glutathione S-transferase family protein n=1 Tax=Brevundimonas sp. TaxID=1871086 RepID=UPI00271A4147|nr:glutathione S-transferase family protein [Brevundimonas sp.]MDO9076237.1 glutathione S-transferase family protein [Brevundimonas sp.]MDZ4061047.1 glutathione S-transferase family protein [Brevundimonas sp.]